MPVLNETFEHVDAEFRPQSRSMSERRRRRLYQILEREAPDSRGGICAAKTLPSLLLPSSKSVSAEGYSPMLVKSTPNLSPLRINRPTTRQTAARTARVVDVEPSARIDRNSDQTAHTAVENRVLSEQVERSEELQRSHAQQLAKQFKDAQLEQIHDKLVRRRERKIDAQADAELLVWEQTQLDLVGQTRWMAQQIQLLDFRDSQLHSLKTHRCQANAAKIVQQFFDRLAVLEPSQAMEMFVSKPDELVRCCMDLLGPSAEQREFEGFKDMLKGALKKEEKILQHRVVAARREEEVKMLKQCAVADVKKAHFDEIQRHLAVTADEKTKQWALRSEITAQQEVLDRRYEATQKLKKQRNLELSQKLQEQIRRNKAERATVSLRVDGKSSPVLWTPYWSEESHEGQGETDHNIDIPSPGRQILAKKKCQWYD